MKCGAAHTLFRTHEQSEPRKYDEKWRTKSKENERTNEWASKHKKVLNDWNCQTKDFERCFEVIDIILMRNHHFSDGIAKHFFFGTCCKSCCGKTLFSVSKTFSLRQKSAKKFNVILLRQKFYMREEKKSINKLSTVLTCVKSFLMFLMAYEASSESKLLSVRQTGHAKKIGENFLFCIY